MYLIAIAQEANIAKLVAFQRFQTEVRDLKVYETKITTENAF